MSEQDLVKKCTAAFPELEKSGSPGIFETTDPGQSLLDLFKNRSPETLQKQISLAKELGFPESGSVLIDTAHAKHECVVKTAQENEKKDIISTAEGKLAAAIAKGGDSAIVMSLGKGKSLVSDVIFEAPKLTEHQKAILDGINKNQALEALVVQDKNKKSEFHMIVQERKKN